MKKYYFFILIGLSGIMYSRVTCSQFNSWKEAQAYLEAKKPGYKSLDRDHDGEACESMSRKKTKHEKHIIQIFSGNHMTGFGRSYSSLNSCKKGASRFHAKNPKLTYKCIREKDL